LTINKGWLSLKEMHVDKNPFSVNTNDLQDSKVLIRLEQAETAKGKNVVISEKRTITTDEKILSWEVVVEKNADGKESLKITIKAPTLGGGHAQAKIAEEMVKQPKTLQLVRPVHATSQTSLAGGGTQHHLFNRLPIPVRLAFEPMDDREPSSKRVHRRGDGS
jgi:hypothetical protein